MPIVNEGLWDRVLRLVAGITALVVATSQALPPWGTITLFVVGGLLVLTGAIGWCPLYQILGINTNGRSPVGRERI